MFAIQNISLFFLIFGVFIQLLGWVWRSCGPQIHLLSFRIKYFCHLVHQIRRRTLALFPSWQPIIWLSFAQRPIQLLKVSIIYDCFSLKRFQVVWNPLVSLKFNVLIFILVWRGGVVHLITSQFLVLLKGWLHVKIVSFCNFLVSKRLSLCVAPYSRQSQPRLLLQFLLVLIFDWGCKLHFF